MSELPPIRMIATDIDGTMLRSDGSLSPRVRDSLLAAKAAGIEVVPTTGRPYMVSTDVIEASTLDGYWIFANGAVTWHLGEDRLVRGHWIEEEAARRLVIELRAALPDAGFAIEMERAVSFEPGFLELVPIRPTAGQHADVLDGLTNRVQKVLVFHPGLTLDKLFELVGRVVGDHAVPSYSGLSFIEVAPTLVTKASAIEDLAADLGIGRDEVATFGDNHNDVSMLGWTSRSHAMANATRDAKDAAAEIIGANDDDGLAIAVEELTAQRIASA